MVSFTVLVVDENGEPVSNATVVSKVDVLFLGEKLKEAVTDNNGSVTFEGDILTTYQIEASKSGSFDSGTLRVNINDSTPEVLKLQLFFQPLKKGEQILGKLGSELKNNTRTLSIGFAVVGSAVVVLWLLNKAKSPSVPDIKIPKVNLRRK